MGDHGCADPFDLVKDLGGDVAPALVVRDYASEGKGLTDEISIYSLGPPRLRFTGLGHSQDTTQW